MKAFEAAENSEEAEDALAAWALEINKLQKEKQKIDRELKDIIEGIPKAKQEMETAKILIPRCKRRFLCEVRSFIL